MGYQITVPIYEMKTNLSRYIRALSRGDCDIVIIKRHGRGVAALISLVDTNKPAREPQCKEDIAMRSRARWVETGVRSRRVPG